MDMQSPLRWRHNDHAGVPNHQPHGCLLNRLFRRKSKKTSKLRVTGLCAGNSPGTGEFPAQMASYAENVAISWRHHASIIFYRVNYSSMSNFNWKLGHGLLITPSTAWSPSLRLLFWYLTSFSRQDRLLRDQVPGDEIHGHRIFKWIEATWLNDWVPVKKRWLLDDMPDYFHWIPNQIWPHSTETTLIARFMQPTWGPSGADRTQVGPKRGHVNLAIWADYIALNVSRSWHSSHDNPVLGALITALACRRL